MKSAAVQSPWTSKELGLLGSKPDDAVARQIHRTEAAVKLKRQQLGIQAPLQPPWTEEETRLLGTRADREVARLIKRSLAAVQTKRLLLGIKSWRPSFRKSAGPVEPEKVKLLFGPYHPPRARRGQWLFCERRGSVKVGQYSSGPISWPMKWKTRSIILCGGLVQAVKQESELAVAHHWGVCAGTVTQWRKALEVEPMTTGTQRLKSFVTTEAMTPALRAHISQLKQGKPVNYSPEGKARILAALHRPKPAKWFASMAPHFAARRGKPVDPRDRPWTPEEERLLGSKPDRELAKELDRTVEAVMARRTLKDIPYLNPLLRKWTRPELKLLRKLPDEEVARLTGHPLKSVQTKRQALRLLVRPRPQPWTPEQERLLGTRPDTELAALLKRGRADVRLHRVALGIAPAVERSPHRDWTPAEDKLLGTASDAEIGRRLGRTTVSVQLRRLGLGLRSHRACKLAT